MTFLSHPRTPLLLLLVLLTIDSALEFSLITTTVSFLHFTQHNQYPFTTPDGQEGLINAKPLTMLTNQGHTSNGAAGTAMYLISFGGFLVLWRMGHLEKSGVNRLSKLFLFYTILTFLSFLLTLSALIFVFITIHQTSPQSIDPILALSTQGTKYPLGTWAPDSWTKALIDLPITDETDLAYLKKYLNVMMAWTWNLIPLLVIGVVVAGVSVRECLRQRKMERGAVGAGRGKGDVEFVMQT